MAIINIDTGTGQWGSTTEMLLDRLSDLAGAKELELCSKGMSQGVFRIVFKDKCEMFLSLPKDATYDKVCNDLRWVKEVHEKSHKEQPCPES